MTSEVGLRVRALNITTAASASAAYNAQTWKSARFPVESVRDALLNAVAHFAEVIAETANHPWRILFAGTTGSLADAAAIPSTVGGFPIIGVYGEVRDASDGRHCSPKGVTYIERVKRLAYDDYCYAIVGAKIRHTRTNVVMDVCRYDAATERTAAGAAGAAGNMILPDTLEPAVVAHALANLVVTDEYQGQAGYYGAFAAAVAEQIRAGMTNVDATLKPAPQPAGRAE